MPTSRRRAPARSVGRVGSRRRSGRGRADQAHRAGHRRGLGPGAGAELGQDARHVHAGRLLADEQALADLAVRAPRGHQGQHLQLASGEPERHRRASGAAVTFVPRGARAAPGRIRLDRVAQRRPRRGPRRPARPPATAGSASPRRPADSTAAAVAPAAVARRGREPEPVPAAGGLRPTARDRPDPPGAPARPSPTRPPRAPQRPAAPAAPSARSSRRSRSRASSVASGRGVRPPRRRSLRARRRRRPPAARASRGGPASRRRWSGATRRSTAAAASSGRPPTGPARRGPGPAAR